MPYIDSSEKGQVDGVAPLDLVGQVPLVHLPTSILTTSNLTAHEAASDPHPGYQRESEKGAANGYASLDSSGTVPGAQLPLAWWGWNSGALTMVPATQSVIYTVPTGKAAAVYHLLVKNVSATSKAVDVHMRESGAGSSYSLGSVTLGEEEYAIYTDAGVIPMSDGDTIEAFADDGTSVHILVLVQENG